jgi:AcrR family transcriptional regulator
MTELTPREKRQQRTHQAILDAARQLINEKGLEGLSMRAIAERIEYSPAGLYEYFGSKEEIIGAICSQGHRRLRAYLDRVERSLSFQEHLLGIGLAYVEFAVQNPDFFILMFTTLPSGVASLAAIEQGNAQEILGEDSSFPILLKAIERGVSEGILSPQPGFGVMEMAFAAWSVVHGIAMLRVTYLRHFVADFDQIARATLLALGKGLAAGRRKDGG